MSTPQQTPLDKVVSDFDHDVTLAADILALVQVITRTLASARGLSERIHPEFVSLWIAELEGLPFAGCATLAMARAEALSTVVVAADNAGVNIEMPYDVPLGQIRLTRSPA